MKRFLFALVALSASAVQAETMIIGAHSALGDFKPYREALALDTVRFANRSGVPARSFFNDGSDPIFDAFSAKKNLPLSPMGLVFEASQSGFYYDKSNERTYRNHRLRDADAATEAVVTKALRPFYERQAAKPSWLIIFSDALAALDEDGFDAMLWGQGRLTTGNVARAHNIAGASGSARYFADYCGSNALHQLAWPSTLQSEAESCGFASYSVLEAYNGCSVKTGDHNNQHQYASIWLEALQSEGNANTTKNADFDNDATITPLEAHRYASVYIEGPQVPVSSSDAFLASWGKGFVPVLPSHRELPDNHYRALAEIMARRLGYPKDPDKMIEEAQQDRATATQRLGEIDQSLHQSKARYDELAGQIKHGAIAQWPELATPYTSEYLNTVVLSSLDVTDYIVNHPRYTDLLNERVQIKHLKDERERSVHIAGALDRLFLMRHLSKMHRRLYQVAGQSDINRYQSLLRCEGIAFGA